MLRGLSPYSSLTGDVFEMIPGYMDVDGRRLSFLNDLDIAFDGTVYFTDSSRYTQGHFLWDVLEGKPYGR